MNLGVTQSAGNPIHVRSAFSSRGHRTVVTHRSGHEADRIVAGGAGATACTTETSHAETIFFDAEPEPPALSCPKTRSSPEHWGLVASSMSSADKSRPSSSAAYSPATPRAEPVESGDFGSAPGLTVHDSSILRSRRIPNRLLVELGPAVGVVRTETIIEPGYFDRSSPLLGVEAHEEVEPKGSTYLLSEKRPRRWPSTRRTSSPTRCP